MRQNRPICMTEGPICQELLWLAFPVLLSQLLQQLYNMADAAIIGHAVGAAGLAAVGSAGLLLSVLVNFFIGLSTGISIVVSQFYGARQSRPLRECIHTAAAASLLFGLLFQFMGQFGAGQFLIWLHTPEEAAEPAFLYLQICFFGMVPQLIYNVGTAVLRALGDTRSPLYDLAVCALLNILLDVLFVTVLHLDIQGAAAATLASQCLSALLVIRRLMLLPADFRLNPCQIRLHLQHLHTLALMGIPAGFQAVFMSISSLVIQTSINSFGTGAMAGMTVFSKVEGFLYFPLFSLGIAVTSFIGQNAGAGQSARIRQGMQISLLISLIVWAASAFLLMSQTPLLLTLFTSDPVVTAYAATAIHYLFPFYGLYAVNQVYIGVLRGMGQTFSPMAITVLCYCIFRITWCRLLLPLWHDMRVIYLSYVLSWVVMLALLYLSSRRCLAGGAKDLAAKQTSGRA